jgi:hypothetical protein
MHTKQKVLFILKKKKLYDDVYNAKTIHSGLYNSANFVSDMLLKNGIESECVQVNDNNDIDRVVTKFKPTSVVIEALWVVPEKFDVLHKRHPNVTWIIRLHSEMPFIANEGSAMEWIYKYSELFKTNKVLIAPNTEKMYNDLKSIGINNLVYLPNYYPTNNKNCTKHFHRKYINVGCFGAVRPMKNQLIQAVAAIDFGNQIGKPVHFHMNTERIEKGESVIKNIRALFANQDKHILIEHPWYCHSDFINIIRKMDIGLQVSFNETFNIVAADMVDNGIPVIGSKEIYWLNRFYKAECTTRTDIVKKMKFAYKWRNCNFHNLNKKNLKRFSKNSESIWLSYFR